jgi:hypothetical protein
MEREEEAMIYEVRTYTLRPGTVAEFAERYAKRLPLREQHSKLGAFWHTDVGTLNQVIHVYPYDDLQQRTAVRDALAKDTARAQLPGGREFIVAQEAEIMIPAPFMHPLGSRDYGSGNVYEMRIYTYEPGQIPVVLEAGLTAPNSWPLPEALPRVAQGAGIKSYGTPSRASRPPQAGSGRLTEGKACLQIVPLQKNTQWCPAFSYRRAPRALNHFKLATCTLVH